MSSRADRRTEQSRRLVESCGLFATAALALALPCFLYDLNLPDEPRVAHTSFEMLRTGDFVLPTVNGDSFLDTPPCFYWLLALWYWLVGTEPDGVARLLPVACGVGTLLVTYLLTRRHAGRRAGLLSVAILASTFHFWDISHRVTVDMALTLFTNAALFCLAAILLESRIRLWWGPLFGVFAAMTFLTKGVVGPGILSLVLVAMLVRHRDLWTRARFVALVSSVAAAVVVLLPWIGALYLRDPSYPSAMAFEHVWQRAVGGVAHNPSNWQFSHRMLLHLMPWTIVLPFVLYGQGRRAWKRSGADDRDTARFIEFLLLAFLLPLVVLLISRGKRNLYLLPVVPAVAMLTGIWLERQLDARLPGRLVAALVWICGLGGAAGLVATLLVAPANRSGLVLAALIVHFYWSVRWLRRRRREKRDSISQIPREVSTSVHAASLLIVLCVAAWGSFYHVRRNPRYTAAPLGLRVAALERQNYEIAGYRLFQREYAAVAWYLRHPFLHLEEPEGLRALVEKGKAIRAEEGAGRLALMVEAGELEGLSDVIAGWNNMISGWKVYPVKLRRREVVVLVRE